MSDPFDQLLDPRGTLKRAATSEQLKALPSRVFTAMTPAEFGNHARSNLRKDAAGRRVTCYVSRREDR